MENEKTPEQIAAELEMQAQAAAAEAQAREERLAERKAKAGELHFELDGEVYVPLIPSIFIPRLGKRTALEICADEEAQKFLVQKELGTAVRLID